MYEVEILEGAHRGTKGVASSGAMRVIQPRQAAANRRAAALKAAKERTVDPTSRAKSLVLSGINLEKLGNTKGAMDFYRQAIELAPDSAQAAEARKRRRDLEEKARASTR
ncbi:MAG: tetratricopeptide repeat protein [Isosphaeraceae bacterium]